MQSIMNAIMNRYRLMDFSLSNDQLTKFFSLRIIEDASYQKFFPPSTLNS